MSDVESIAENWTREWRHLLRRTLARNLQHYGIIWALVVVVLLVHMGNSHFLTSDNVLNIGSQWSYRGIVVVGMVFVLVVGGFDLSVGATFGTSALVAAIVSDAYGGGAGLVAALAVGAAIGAANGVLVTKLHVNAFVATLGMAFLIRGAAGALSNNNTYTVDSSLFRWLGDGRLGVIPVSLILFLILAILLGLVLWRSAWGLQIYATGGNSEAARLAGIRVDAIRMSAFVLVGMCAALGGVLLLGQTSNVQAASFGMNLEIEVIAAALIGGVSIAGGEGAVWRGVAGVTLLAVLQNYFNLSGSGAWQDAIKGAVLILAVAMDSWTRNRRTPMRRRDRVKEEKLDTPHPRDARKPDFSED